MKKITRLFLVVIMFALGVNLSFADDLGDVAQSKMMVAISNQKALTPEQCAQVKNLVEKTYSQEMREINDRWYSYGPTKQVAVLKVAGAVKEITSALKPKCPDIKKMCVYGLEEFFPECVNKQTFEDKLMESKKKIENAMAYAAGNPSATVTVNRRAVEYLIDAMVRQYRKDLNETQQSGIIEAATIEFQKRLTKENKITAGDVAKLCSLMFKASNDNTCSTFNKKIAKTMRFVRPCTNPKAKGAGLCSPKFKDVDAQYRDALGLIRLEYFMKNGKDEVYCRSKTEELSNQDYMVCKTFDGKVFEVEFDDLTESYQDRIVEDVSIAATKIIWGEDVKYKWNEDGPCGPNQRTGAWDESYTNYVMLLGKDEASCKKDETKVKQFFNGWTKYTPGTRAKFDGKTPAGCVVRFYGSEYGVGALPNDLKDFGVDNNVFKHLHIRNGAELDPLFENYLIHKVEIHGGKPGRAWCDSGAGNVQTNERGFMARDLLGGNAKDRYIMCHIMVGTEQLNVAFAFKDTSELEADYAASQLDGFKCVTKAGGTFEGGQCHGLDKEYCTALGNSGKVHGGTKWDPALETCVFNDAKYYIDRNEKIETAIKVGETVVTITVAVVAAIPTGGASFWAVAGLIGTGASIAGKQIQETAHDLAEMEFDPILARASRYKSICEQEKGGQYCRMAAQEIITGFVTYSDDDGNMLISDTQRTAGNEVIASSVSFFDDDTYGDLYKEIAEITEQSNLITLDQAGKITASVGAVIGLIGFGVGIAKNVANAKSAKDLKKIESFVNKDAGLFKRVVDGVKNGAKKVYEIKGELYSDYFKFNRVASPTTYEEGAIQSLYKNVSKIMK